MYLFSVAVAKTAKKACIEKKAVLIVDHIQTNLPAFPVKV
jgi:hypothetical protein